jgi:hypothetical protein
MPDVWATVADLDPAMQDRLAGVLETRGADAQQQAMPSRPRCSTEPARWRRSSTT